jgi:hypothetical protein
MRNLLIKITFTILYLFFIYPAFSQDIKVANYFTGKLNTDDYEAFSFWIKDAKIFEIIYRYGKWAGQKDYKLVYLGVTLSDSKKCFKVKFPNNYELFIIPDGVKLKIIDKNKKYNKVFTWEYEGPVDGKGTFCNVCAQDENEAMEIINKYFLK